MSKTRTAQCVCGALSITVDGDPSHVNLCSCDDCQRRSGSVFQTSVVFRDDQIVTYSGERSTYTRPTERGAEVTLDFCPTCGVSILFRISDLDGRVLIHGGCFADPTLPKPTHIWFADKAHPWVSLPEGKIMRRT